MTGLRDGLEQWALSRGEEVAASVIETEAEIRDAIHARRTRHALVFAAAAVAAVVGGVAILSAGPKPFTPAPGVMATGGPATTLVESQVPAELECGAPWTMHQGLIQHADAVPGEVSGEWQLRENSGAWFARPARLRVNDENLEWFQTSNGSSPDTGSMVTTIVAVDPSGIVGVAPATGSGLSEGNSEFGVIAALPGTCGEQNYVANDGSYTFHVVTQLLDSTGKPMATWVDPGGAVTVDVSNFDGPEGASATPAATGDASATG